MTFDTVLIDTSATRATSRMVTDMPTHLPASAGVFNARTHNEVQYYYVEDRSRGRSNLGIEIHAHIAERGPWGCSGHTGGDLGRRGPDWIQARFQGLRALLVESLKQVCGAENLQPEAEIESAAEAIV